ncbi:molybdopterin molybdotransferase MoeA [Limnobacter litoralis]|uniref:Molybdopterin molybdenumtransferase n=2 Tax=Limnobacter TaxID=131079 RepID=A0ABQ5YSH4_9BURK|nr:gephyrin-like molybdotransferase Glp [Limnobacter litoralis]GLR25873.1 molybdopterin molybdenumtransferase MoeA [Limnobacter litoralis]
MTDSNKTLRVDEAKAAINALLNRVTTMRRVALRDALDQILAEDILSPIDVPPHDNSAMDGYAFSGQSLQPELPQTRLKIAGTVLAGQAYEGSVARGECVRIMTGAPMPANCDTVIMQELTTTDAERTCVSFDSQAVRPGDNRRLRGEDLTRGKPALVAGKVLRPADLGLLASIGIAEVPVYSKLRVAFFSTGDELRSLGQVLDAGCIYDSNRYTLFGMLMRLRFIELIDLGVVQDSPEALEAAMQRAADHADVILTSGGVSVGEADFTKDVVEKLGSVNFWKIAMRPGRPMAFGLVNRTQRGGQAVLFGLPGNPVAVMVTFYAFVREALYKLAGSIQGELPVQNVKLAHDVRKKPGRTEYQRARIEWRDGQAYANLTGSQGSGILRSMSDCDGLLLLTHDQGSLSAGDSALFVPFEGLV